MLSRSGGVLNKTKQFGKNNKLSHQPSLLKKGTPVGRLVYKKNTVAKAVLAAGPHQNNIRGFRSHWNPKPIPFSSKSFKTRFGAHQSVSFAVPKTSLPSRQPIAASLGLPMTLSSSIHSFSPRQMALRTTIGTNQTLQLTCVSTSSGSSTQRALLTGSAHPVLPKVSSNNANLYFLFIAAGLAGLLTFTNQDNEASAAEVDYNAVRKDIADLLDNPRYEDGSMGPLLIRLAWHASGTWDEKTQTGGSNGATMRFPLEANDGANAGLHIARNLLEPVKAKHPSLTYADLWTLAGVVAVEEAGGPTIPWRSGRLDAVDEKTVPPNGRLPDASQGAQHIRDVFYRMGFNDQEIVALAGAHTFGRCHTDRSGFEGPWTKAPTMFSNSYFMELLNQQWTERRWKGPRQYQDASGELMMLPADLAFRDDPQFRKWTELYAKDEEKFSSDFAAAYSKLLHLGVPTQPSKPWWKFW